MPADRTSRGRRLYIIPAHTAAVLYVRALERDYLREVVRRFEACARGAARATGCEARISPEPYLSKTWSTRRPPPRPGWT